MCVCVCVCVCVYINIRQGRLQSKEYVKVFYNDKRIILSEKQNVKVLNKRTSKYMKQKQAESKGEIHRI